MNELKKSKGKRNMMDKTNSPVILLPAYHSNAMGNNIWDIIQRIL